MEKLKINKIVKPTTPVLIQAVVFEGCGRLVKKLLGVEASWAGNIYILLLALMEKEILGICCNCCRLRRWE